MDERTRLIRSATRRPEARRPVNPPIERGTTLLNRRAADLRDENLGPVYGIDGASVHVELRQRLAEMEGAADTFVVSTGLAAVSLALLALVSSGDEILISDASYWPSRRLLQRTMKRLGVTFRAHHPRATPDEIATLFTDRTRVLLMESPGTATFEIQDVPDVVARCRDAGVHSVVDNTWAAGLLFKPLAHGADISVQALSKYVSGHSDVFGGAVSCGSAVVARRVNELIEDLGLYVSPDDAWLMLRGLRTLPVRLAQHEANARHVADWLRVRPEVSEVLWPALASSPDHALWQRDFTGAASLMGVVLNGGDTRSAAAMLDTLELFGLGFSWGGYESLATCEDAQLAARSRPPQMAGPLIRLHIGLENPDDLIADLTRGLAAYRSAKTG
ncbi:cystathionine beta-lyase [Brevundimonas aveniformis]|uniref:cystathionine beta-lyase n=1 Tax=Brevundimonas aveniformis TaxID=370977 RepID=UPI002493327B|nr:cystathionine beta-lyase [Brevundimonas aveniformis]